MVGRTNPRFEAIRPLLKTEVSLLKPPKMGNKVLTPLVLPLLTGDKRERNLPDCVSFVIVCNSDFGSAIKANSDRTNRIIQFCKSLLMPFPFAFDDFWGGRKRF
ncbi:MAG: hypothetical protein MUD14_26795 [Hydrococcus sp. Prado102]|jgi:hypothetical protein|nr:hypothetical protein [Hydrococcus sp. Prado102]